MPSTTNHPDDHHPEAIPTLASLRRRSSPRRPAPAQPDLFSSLSDPQPEHPASPTALPVPAPPQLPPAASAASPPPVPEPALQQTTARLSEPVRPHPPPAPASEPEPQLQTEPQTELQTGLWTVSGLVGHVRGLVERGYGQVTVEGEISNWRPAGSGHCYFTVKDAGAQLSAVIFRRQASLLRFRPKDGDAVRLHGQLSIYENRGQMQLIVDWVQQVGLGALLAELQRLKERLRREGLFDRKRPLPPFPRCIGVITSLHGAALRDVVKVCRRRHAAVQLLIYPAAVQGPNCPVEIASGLRWFNTHPDRAEVVLVARGGGSWEDLHGFDDEAIARAIATSTLPVITGIGHATDSTLADAAADLSAPTPSAAAELLTSAQHQVEEHLGRLTSRLNRSGSFELLRAQQRLARLSAGTVLRRVEDSLNRRSQRLDELGFRAETSLRNRLRRGDLRLQVLETRLHRQDPSRRLDEVRRRLLHLDTRLRQVIELRTSTSRGRIDRSTTHLQAISPLRVLERGYALVYSADGHLLRHAASTLTGQEIRARLADGELRAKVL